MVPGMPPWRTSGITWRLGPRLSALSWVCALLKSGTTPSLSAGTWSRTSSGELYSAPTTRTRPTRVSLTCRNTTPCVTCCSGRSTYTDW
ncbi:hypothetical protein D9M69_716950 [compost metagenome]